MLQWTYTQTLDDMSESIRKVGNREWYEPMKDGCGLVLYVYQVFCGMHIVCASRAVEQPRRHKSDMRSTAILAREQEPDRSAVLPHVLNVCLVDHLLSM